MPPLQWVPNHPRRLHRPKKHTAVLCLFFRPARPTARRSRAKTIVFRWHWHSNSAHQTNQAHINSRPPIVAAAGPWGCKHTRPHLVHHGPIPHFHRSGKRSISVKNNKLNPVAPQSPISLNQFRGNTFRHPRPRAVAIKRSLGISRFTPVSQVGHQTNPVSPNPRPRPPLQNLGQGRRGKRRRKKEQTNGDL